MSVSFRRARWVGALALFTGAACVRSTSTADARERSREAEVFVVQVVRSYPHDREAFTQGLLHFDGWLYESTGLPGRSTIRRVEMETGRVEQQVRLEGTLFGEGLERVGDRLFQLTWQDGRALVWDLRTLRKLREYAYGGEGWGLCFDGKRLVMSDGSNRLTFRDPKTFARTGELAVTHLGRPVSQLNELECAEGHIYANVWQQNEIVRVDPASGRVTAIIDASGLLTSGERAGTDVLNGIAYLPHRGTFLLTGKLWPRLFEVKFVPKAKT